MKSRLRSLPSTAGSDFNSEGMAWLHLCLSKSLVIQSTRTILRATGGVGHDKGVGHHSFMRPIQLSDFGGLGWVIQETRLRMRSWRSSTSKILELTGRKLKNMGWKYPLPSFTGTYSTCNTMGAINQLQLALLAANSINTPSCPLPY